MRLSSRRPSHPRLLGGSGGGRLPAPRVAAGGCGAAPGGRVRGAAAAAAGAGGRGSCSQPPSLFYERRGGGAAAGDARRSISSPGFMNGTDMEEIPFQKVKTKRKKCCHCCCSPPAAAAAGAGAGLGDPPPLLLLDAIACEDEFDCKELEALFQSYNLKLEQTSTLKALAVLIVLTASLALVELLSGPSLTISKGSHPVHCIIFLSLFIVTNVKYLQVTQLQQIVKLTLLFSFTFSFLCCPFSLGAYGMEPPSAPEQGMWQLMLVTFVSYSLLPVRTLLAIVFGLVVSVSHLIVTAASVSAKRQRLWRTVSEGRAGPGRALQRGAAGRAGRRGAARSRAAEAAGGGPGSERPVRPRLGRGRRTPVLRAVPGGVPRSSREAGGRGGCGETGPPGFVSGRTAAGSRGGGSRRLGGLGSTARTGGASTAAGLATNLARTISCVCSERFRRADSCPRRLSQPGTLGARRPSQGSGGCLQSWAEIGGTLKGGSPPRCSPSEPGIPPSASPGQPLSSPSPPSRHYLLAR